ncbi:MULTISPECIES: hypothetical protein [unclassified Nostoc]|nr:hypothetical protein [Nostoc sp. S13]MDF5735558.1 hypothetical protein [Nostoc sp. S13]
MGHWENTFFIPLSPTLREAKATSPSSPHSPFQLATQHYFGELN